VQHETTASAVQARVIVKRLIYYFSSTPVRSTQTSVSSLYYITFTCFNWLPLFQLVNAYDLVYKWFEYLKAEKNIKTTAYVIMPNHLHCILFFPVPDCSLNSLIGNAKRFIAYEIIKRLKNNHQTEIVQQLEAAVSNKERTKGQLHKVFEESFDAKSIDDKKFFLQKLNYIHLNPVRGNYKLISDWREYEHSSAGFYELQQVKHFTPVHYLDLE
jgi:REP element-mobilizing transposase RayT